MGWSSPPASGGGSIAPLVVESANVVAQRNGVNAQTEYVYGTDDWNGSSRTNYSRLKITHGGGTGGATIATENGGTGTAGGITLSSGSNSINIGPASSAMFSAATINTNGLALFVYGGLFSVGNNSGGASFSVESAVQNKAVFQPSMLFGWSSTTGDSGALRGGLDTAMYRNAAGVIEINSGTAGTFRDLIARNVRTSATTVASLTAAATAGAGARSFVTDATSPTFGATVTGGGSTPTPVYSDGTNWKVG